MKKRIIIAGLGLAALILLGAGCASTEVAETTNDSTEVENANVVADAEVLDEGVGSNNNNSGEVVSNVNENGQLVNANSRENSNTVEVNDNTNIRIASTSNDVDTSDWSKFTFDELQFSILLPFRQKDLVTNYTECDRDSACDKFGYSYAVTLNDEYVVLRSVSEHWSPSRNWSFGEIYDFEATDDTYIVKRPNDRAYPVYPIKIVNSSKQLFYIFDAYDYFKLTEVIEDGEVVLSEGGRDSQYAVVFLLPENDRYKAAILTFKKEDLSLGELEVAVGTIEFF